MTNTGKALIIALVLVDVGFIAYQLLPKGDRSEAAPDAVTASSVTAAAVDPRVDGNHTTAGNVVPTLPSANSAGAGARSPSRSGPVANNAQTQAQPPASRHAHASRAPAAAQTREPAATQANTAQPNGRARDDLTRHGSNAVAAAMTEQLVRESSKPDPSLPMPPPVQSAPPASQDHRGSNPVAAAMTQELVRESARVNAASQGLAPSGTQ